MNILNALNFENKSLSFGEVQSKLSKLGIYGDLGENIEILKAYGLPLLSQNSTLSFETATRKKEDEIFCIVDIETNGPSPKNAQVIEIGAIKIQNGKIIDRCESLVYASEVPEMIVNLTNIHASDLVDAPKLQEVMERFRIFLADGVFVAHNVAFDFSFLSQMMENCGLGPILNRRLCTIDLAHRTIEAPRYGLKYLTEHLSLNNDNHHRAFSDALNTVEIFNISSKELPPTVVTTEDLIKFSKSAKKKFMKPKVEVQKD